MAIKCPKCYSDNPPDSKYCKECATPFPTAEEIPLSHTKTLQTPVKDLIKGTTFAGRYQIIQELGRGGMGVVYKAQDTKLKRTVALKFLPPELTHISEVKDRFMREAQAAAALDHPHICTVYEFDEAEDKTFISMAYIEGQSLKKKIESGPLELDEALRIATQVAEGLQEAHKKGVVHRDIKSANIMVTDKGQAKIMDFGLARAPGRTLITKEGMTMGTIAYMSPQQARGEEVDHRTDIWSLGVVLYEMFTGQRPFKGEHDQAVVYSILKEKPKPITDLKAEIPMAIEQVVGKALEKNPDDRYQQIEDLLDDLRSISEGIVPEGVRARLRKIKILKRKRAILYAGIAGLLIIMTVIALSLFTGRTEAIDSVAVLPLENLFRAESLGSEL
ncbi:MAG: protein kinase [bacterium]